MAGTLPRLSCSILMVEDEAMFARAVCKRLAAAGYACRSVGTLAEAREALADAPDLILLDLRLPDGEGFELLSQLSTEHVRPTVVVMTAYGELAPAIEAMKLGAADYIKKPIDLNELLLVVQKVLSTAQLRQRVDYSRERESHSAEGMELLGNSALLRATRTRLESLSRLCATPGVAAPTVLLLGETGTGKDVAARLLHRSGPLSGRPFVQIDCASLPRELIEAELFGHEKGAYTGAQSKRVGLIEAAEDGTVFLDEIGEMGLDLQAKLLNVLERRVVRRVGAVREYPVAARFVAGTNRDLPRMVAQGQFRADLFYRLNVIAVQMPTLRDRRNDIVPLARHFAQITARRYGLQEPNFEETALDALVRYPWPGNVRELKHLIERAVLLSGHTISASELALPVPEAAVPQSAAAGEEDPTPMGREMIHMTLEEAERHLIEHALHLTRGNVSEAARRLGVTRMALRYRIDKLKLSPASG
ncbi:MAG TPA: sigma-54 dependent transcriptional regulator [Burkholderiaceae bacterium]|nr:sigma-54 dependent transcriptional regulator [Burkholderiaceae bacterium]